MQRSHNTNAAHTAGVLRFDLCSESSTAPLERHCCRGLGLCLHCSANLYLRMACYTQHWTRDAASCAYRANLHLRHWRDNGARLLVLFLLLLLLVAILSVLVVVVVVQVVVLRHYRALGTVALLEGSSCADCGHRLLRPNDVEVACLVALSRGRCLACVNAFHVAADCTPLVTVKAVKPNMYYSCSRAAAGVCIQPLPYAIHALGRASTCFI